MTFMKFWKFGSLEATADDSEVLPEVITPARVLLEVNNNGVSVSALDENGCVTRTVPLGVLETGEHFSVAEGMVRKYGWLTHEDWFDTGGSHLVDLSPVPITAAIVGGVLENKDALRYARQAGLEVIDVVGQNYVEDEGKNYVSFSVETPRGWSW